MHPRGDVRRAHVSVSRHANDSPTQQLPKEYAASWAHDSRPPVQEGRVAVYCNQMISVCSFQHPSPGATAAGIWEGFSV